MDAVPRPESLFAPVLESERLLCKLFNTKNESHMTYILDMANSDLPSLAPDGKHWSADDWIKFDYSVRMKPSDAHGKTPDAACVYMMYLKSDPDTIIGLISLCRRVPDMPMDLGYSVSAEYRRKGYGSEAAERVNRYWRDEFGLKEMCIVTGEDNEPSLKLVKRVGYVDGGYVMFNGSHRMAAFVLPGMEKLDGQSMTFWGDGKMPDGGQ